MHRVRRTSSRTPRSRIAGFSLLELMIALVVVGVLAAIAYPSFMASIRKSRRSEAFNALNAVQQAQERFRGNNAGYSSLLTAAPTAVPPGLGLTATTGNGYYSIALSDVAANTYVASATAVAGTTQASDGNCAKLGVRMTGGNLEYAGTTTAGAFAWAATNACWSR